MHMFIVFVHKKLDKKLDKSNSRSRVLQIQNISQFFKNYKCLKQSMSWLKNSSNLARN